MPKTRLYPKYKEMCTKLQRTAVTMSDFTQAEYKRTLNAFSQVKLHPEIELV